MGRESHLASSARLSLSLELDPCSDHKATRDEKVQKRAAPCFSDQIRRRGRGLAVNTVQHNAKKGVLLVFVSLLVHGFDDSRVQRPPPEASTRKGRG